MSKNTMTTAITILNTTNGADAALTAAEKMTGDIDQDWDGEAITCVFPDGSVLMVSGSKVSAYDTLEHYRAHRCADSESKWVEYIDPDNTTPFVSIDRDERVRLALEVIQANR